MNQLTHLKNYIIPLTPERMDNLKNYATIITFTLNFWLLATFKRKILNPLVINFRNIMKILKKLNI